MPPLKLPAADPKKLGEIARFVAEHATYPVGGRNLRNRFWGSNEAAVLVTIPTVGAGGSIEVKIGVSANGAMAYKLLQGTGDPAVLGPEIPLPRRGFDGAFERVQDGWRFYPGAHDGNWLLTVDEVQRRRRAMTCSHDLALHQLSADLQADLRLLQHRAAMDRFVLAVATPLRDALKKKYGTRPDLLYSAGFDVGSELWLARADPEMDDTSYGRAAIEIMSGGRPLWLEVSYHPDGSGGVSFYHDAALTQYANPSGVRPIHFYGVDPNRDYAAMAEKILAVLPLIGPAPGPEADAPEDERDDLSP